MLKINLVNENFLARKCITLLFLFVFFFLLHVCYFLVQIFLLFLILLGNWSTAGFSNGYILVF